MLCPTGKGSDDIYAFSETKPLLIEDCKQYIAGILTDLTTGIPILKGKISLFQKDGKLIQSLVTKEDASFNFLVECNSGYKIEATKKEYEANFKSVSTDDGRKAIQNGSITLYSMDEREKQKELALEREKEDADEMAIIRIEKKLLEKKLAEEKRIQKEKEDKVRDNEVQKIANKKHLQDIEKTIAKEEAIIRKDNKIIIKTEEIHFNYSLWYLRRESRERLISNGIIEQCSPN